MQTLAIIISLGVIATIVADLVKDRKLAKSIKTLDSDFSSALSRSEATVENLRILIAESEAGTPKKTRTMISGTKDKPAHQFKDYANVIFAQPYVRLTIETGRRLFISFSDELGNLVLSETEPIKHSKVSHEFKQPPSKAAVATLLNFFVTEQEKLGFEDVLLSSGKKEFPLTSPRSRRRPPSGN